MISRLRGILIEKRPSALLIDVNGVGYECFVSMQTFYHLPDLNQPLILHTQLIIREDAHQLYGFWTLSERSLFCELIKVTGIGPKLALSILSTLTIETFIESISANQTDILVKIPGVGKKTAERLCVEMRDRLKAFPLSAGLSFDKNKIPLAGVSEEAFQALIALGYKPQLAKDLINRVKGDNLSLEQMIRASLQSLAKA